MSRLEHVSLLALVLEREGWVTTPVDIETWLAGTTASPAPDLVLLEAWPLHDPALARLAQERLRLTGAPLILLIEGDEDLPLAHALGAAVALSPLCGLEALTGALERALLGRLPQHARAVGEAPGLDIRGFRAALQDWPAVARSPFGRGAHDHA